MIRYRIKRITAMLTAVLLVVSFAVVAAFSANAVDSKGSIEVYLNPEAEGMPLELYEIGYVEGAGYTLNEQFKALDLKDEYYRDNDLLKDKLKKAQSDILAMNVRGKVARVDMDGYVTYRDLDANKLYFILQAEGSEKLIISPMLIAVPQNINGEVIYDIKGNGKTAMPAKQRSYGAVILNKKNNENVPLEGAVFSFYSKIYYTDTEKYISDDIEKGSDEGGTYYWKYIADKTTDKNGQIYIDRMDFTSYRFVEIKAPEGYKLDPTPHEINVEDEGYIKLENDIYVTESGDPVIFDVVNLPKDEDSASSITIDQSSDIGQDSFIMAESSDKPSFPTPSSTVQTSTTKISITPDITVEITGDDIVKYIAIGAVVTASLVLVIILSLVGRKKDSDSDK